MAERVNGKYLPNENPRIKWLEGTGQGKDQKDDRMDVVASDQYNRKWLYALEKKTMEPCTGFDTVHWTDPLNTPFKYIKQARSNRGQVSMENLIVDFATWLGDQHQALHGESGWFMNLYNIGQDKFKGAKSTEELESDPYILRLAGPKPWPSTEALERAAAGQACLLGQAPIWEMVANPIKKPGVPAFIRKPVMTPDAIEARALLGWTVPADTAGAVKAKQPKARKGQAGAGVASPVTVQAVEAMSYREFVSHVMTAGHAKTIGEAATQWRDLKTRKAAQ